MKTAPRFARVSAVFVVMVATSATMSFAQTRRPQKQNPPTQASPGDASLPENALRFVGVWTAEFMDTTYLHLELKLANGKLTGTIATGDMHTAEDGRLTDVSAADKTQASPLFDVALTATQPLSSAMMVRMSIRCR